MFELMRKVFGPVAVSVIIGAIALVFIFSGVFSPRGTSGTGAGALAASVNGDSVTLQEFSREYDQRIQNFQNMMKGKLDVQLLKQLRLREQVVEDLIRRKLVSQEAHRMGLMASDEEVKEKIREMPYFKKDGQFSAEQYKGVLEANRYSPSTFEELIRDDLLREQVSSFMSGRVHVSEREIENEFLVSKDLRQVDYVTVSRQFAQSKLSVTDAEVDTFLKGDGLNLAKAAYERTKMLYVKPVKKADKKAKAPTTPEAPQYFAFEEVKKKVATDLLKERRVEEVNKILKTTTDDLLAHAKTPADLKAAAKRLGLEYRTSNRFSRNQTGEADMSDSANFLPDAFAENSPLLTSAKMYDGRSGGKVVATALKTFKPVLADLAKEKLQVEQQVRMKKRQTLLEQWMSDLRAKAKVSINTAVTDEAATAEE